MTIEKRFACIEHFFEKLPEQRAREREEDRQLFEDTQRRLNQLALRTSDVNERLGKRIDQLVEEATARDREAHKRDRQLGLRVESLVSAMGEFLAKLQKS